MNLTIQFKAGLKKPLHEIAKWVQSGRVKATNLDGTPFVFPKIEITKSSLAFERPSPYEANGKRERARLHKLPKIPKLPTEDGSEFRKCVLCETNVASNKHHLVPRSKRHLRPDRQHNKAWTCRDCHTDVHWYFNNQELALEYFDIPKLKAELKRRKLTPPAIG